MDIRNSTSEGSYINYMLSIGYSLGWRQLWAYNTREIIGREGSLRRIISRVLYTHNCRAICGLKDGNTNINQISETIVLS